MTDSRASYRDLRLQHVLEQRLALDGIDDHGIVAVTREVGRERPHDSFLAIQYRQHEDDRRAFLLDLLVVLEGNG